MLARVAHELPELPARVARVASWNELGIEGLSMLARVCRVCDELHQLVRELGHELGRVPNWYELESMVGYCRRTSPRFGTRRKMIGFLAA